MTPVYSTILLSLLVTFACAEPVTSPSSPDDVTVSARSLVDDARRLVARAKGGVSLLTLGNDVKALQEMASDLIQVLPGEISECEANLVIKMAAAGTGSHDVLTLLLADDPLEVLSGRLSMSLSFLDHVAQQLEDELTLSGDIGGHLMAVVFGTNNTVNIIESADMKVKAMGVQHDAKDHHLSSRVRRQLRRNLSLGRGWSVGLNGLNWRSRTGRYNFQARPTFRGLKPDGFRAGFTIRF